MRSTNSDAKRVVERLIEGEPGGPLGIIGSMMQAARDSGANLAARISDVRQGPIVGGLETITFKVDGVPHSGSLRGRNAQLAVGFGEESDRGIALRILVDGDVAPVK